MDTSSAPANTEPRRLLTLPHWLIIILRIFVTLMLPLLLVLLNAGLLTMTPVFIRWEYQRPSLPADPFGFTTEDRLEYGPRGLAYLFNDEGPEFLGDLRFEDGSPVFNERELSHMLDVKLVTQKIMRFGIGLLIAYSIALFLLAADPSARIARLGALFQGSILTIVLIITGIATVVFAFDWLFTEFHRLFFSSGTWIFPTDDTLIRIYPYEFWIDTFGFVFALTLLEAIILAVITWRALGRPANP
jgi:integral membrane protein (TIGR01906 family)